MTMNLSMHKLLLILFSISTYNYVSATGPSDPHYQGGVGSTLSSIHRVKTEQEQPGSIGHVDECLNSSLDNNCKNKQPVEVTKQHVYDIEGEVLQNQLDNPMQLLNRLTVIDHLGQSLEFVLNSDANSSSWYSLNKAEPTLRQVLLLHRHGDRTPINFPPKDTLVKEPFWAFHGYGQLTNRGKARLHLLGKMYRRRYNNFLKKSVNKNQRISRSSGSLRCIESAEMFLASFLGLNTTEQATDASSLIWANEQDNQLGRLWQPASIQSVPAAIDGMLAEGAKCNALTDEYMNVVDRLDEVKLIAKKFSHEAEVLNRTYGFEVDHFFKWFWGSSQIEVERSYFEDKMRPEILSIYDRVQEAGNLALHPYQSTLKSKRLRSGLLINDMVQNMKNFRDSFSTADSSSPLAKKFVHYAAHDLTLVILLGMFDSWTVKSERPEYASNIVIELHQDSEWFVKIYYMSFVPSEPIEIHIARCEDEHPQRKCTLDNFAQLMSIYMVDSWSKWMQECENDLHSLDPYSPGS